LLAGKSHQDASRNLQREHRNHNPKRKRGGGGACLQFMLMCDRLVSSLARFEVAHLPRDTTKTPSPRRGGGQGEGAVASAEFHLIFAEQLDRSIQRSQVQT
ncbi:MAG TPA: hypothetical protein VHB77_16660, partial [Planctomycetaceae bacterium]|nr:hypothetical protein [Planctomycetaceae bacterium]